ncbi:MAG: AAC(3) family N-acetyltransferase, partial [Candidatus Bathyarchaeota archaeon]|nr:AAC(3) family N-acetyltransferase [Candidatus Bathyarchaeota archaeon]
MTKPPTFVVEKDQIIKDLRTLGLSDGDHVAVTLSFKSIGYVKGGPKTLIDALLEVVGPNGTVMMNTFTYHFPPATVPEDYVFDSNSTRTYAGLVPETLRTLNEVTRSTHPICSVATIGKMAHYLTDEHNERSEPFLPYSNLAKIDGKYLCIGIGDRLVGIRHEAQQRAGLTKVFPFFQAVRYKTNQGTTKLFVKRFPGCIRNLPKMVPRLKTMGVLKSGKVGIADAYLASAETLIESMTEMLTQNPTLTLCEDASCIWCRELERRMNLFSRIENPK